MGEPVLCGVSIGAVTRGQHEPRPLDRGDVYPKACLAKALEASFAPQSLKGDIHKRRHLDRNFVEKIGM